MDISHTEAEETLIMVKSVEKKMRQAFSRGGADAFLILWGIIWFLGFLGSHFFPPLTAIYIWAGLDILGGVISAVIGIRMSRKVRSTKMTALGKRIALFWLLLFFYCGATIWVADPSTGRQIAMFIILFVMIGWTALGLLVSSSFFVWLGLSFTTLALVGYFLFPGIFNLWMAFLGGGGMIGIGIYIRIKW